MQPLRTLGLLMFMILLCDAASSCPPELTLTVDPPVVIRELGETVLANCSSTYEFHYGMYWRNGNTDSDIEEDLSFITQSLQLSDWNTTAECRIKLNETHECSTDLKIIVYKNPELSMYPINPSSNLVEGMQYELQCDIIEVAPIQNLTVRWYKGQQIIKTQTFSNTTERPVDESSTLMVNVSRGDHGAQFRCEAQLDFGPLGAQNPVISEKRRVSVLFPNKAIPVVMTTPEATTQTTTYPEVSTSAAPDTSTPTISESPTTEASTQTHTETSTEQGCPLVLTPSEIVVKFGDPASINCSTSAPNASIIGWESIIGGTVELPPSVTWMVEKLEHWTIAPKCFVSTDTQQCIVMPVITLYKTPDMVSISAEDPRPMVEGKDFLLTCNVSNVAPVGNLRIQWYRDGIHLHKKQFDDTVVTPGNASSTLRIKPKRVFHGAAYRCKAELHLGRYGPKPFPTVASSPYIADVQYSPIFRGETNNTVVILALGENVTFPCTAEGNPSPETQWKYPSEVNVIETTWGRYRNISIQGATSINAGVYICHATNAIGNVTRSVTVQMQSKSSAGPSWFIWVFLVLCVVVFLIIIIMIILQNRRKKNGEYSFVSGKAKEDIQMTDKA